MSDAPTDDLSPAEQYLQAVARDDYEAARQHLARLKELRARPGREESWDSLPQLPRPHLRHHRGKRL
jgi:hypothetical protein